MVPHAPLWPIWSRLNSGLVLPSFGVSTSDLPGDVVWCFPQVMTNLAPPFFSQIKFVHLPVVVLLAAKAPHCEFCQAANVKDASQATIYESLALLECLSCLPLRLRSIVEKCF